MNSEPIIFLSLIVVRMLLLFKDPDHTNAHNSHIPKKKENICSVTFSLMIISILYELFVIMIAYIAIIISLVSNTQSQSNSSNTTCNDFFDTTNITAGIHNTNGSIIYDKVEYPRNKYQNYSYIMVNGDKVPVQPHIRGCLCQIKICVRVHCADQKESFVNYTREGANCTLYGNDNFIVPVKSENGNSTEIRNVTLKNQTNVAITYERSACKSEIQRKEFAINAVSLT